ncbi:MAG: tetratricopeptide repeat protein, partial [Gemmatimonadaceae bacterium]|nr:tetratricopeptide repeat protein [Gemmatimonadaceae bacterium]
MDGLSRIDELQQKFSENPRRYFAPLANEHRKAGNAAKAIAICREYLAQMPGHMSGQIVYGQALFEGGEYEEAHKVFEGALTLDPENLIALRTLGDLALRTGQTAEARQWYTRLLEADPKDSTVIALVSEIDASLEASPPPSSEQIPTIDPDGGDQAIVQDSVAVGSELLGLERHYPSEDTTSGTSESIALEVSGSGDISVESASRESIVSDDLSQDDKAVDVNAADATTVDATAAEAATADAGRVDEAQVEGTTVEGTTAEPDAGATTQDAPVAGSLDVPPSPATEWQDPAAPPADLDEDFDERDRISDSAPADATVEALPEASAEAAESAPPDPFDTWGAPAGAAVNEVAHTPPDPFAPVSEAKPLTPHATPMPESRPAQSANPEPFVNETMAQLYLQQGYRALALNVYRQLIESRPDEPRLRAKLKELEDEEQGGAESRRDDAPSVESPSPERETPRAPSTEAPPTLPSTQPGSEETPGFDRSPIDSPPSSTPPSERDSVESPGRDDPRAEPELVAARQPSVKEFFAALGRKRPPARMNGDTYGSPPSAARASAAGVGSLESVFAGTRVSAEDDLAATALAGAFTRRESAEERYEAAPPPPSAPAPTPRTPAAAAPAREVSAPPA